LTGEAARDDVDESSPRETVECSDVVPDRERLKVPVVLSSEEDRSRVFVKLDSTNCAPSEKPAAEDAAASARE
jgi:hypothetical protein